MSNASDIDPHDLTFVNISTSVDNGPYRSYPEQCVYGIHGVYIHALQSFLESVLTDVGYTNGRGGISSAGMLANPVLNSWWLASLYQRGNATFDSVGANLENIATTFTNYVRISHNDKLGEYKSNGTTYDAPAAITGLAHRTSICTKFNGLWLLFPAGLILATAILFLLTTALRRCDKGYGPNWKGSLLPLLFYGFVPSDSASKVRFRENAQKDVGSDLTPTQLYGLSHLDELADTTLVRFRRTSHGAGFEVLEPKLPH
ncbi:hypothetical protein IFR05_001419 [Cadophora sp. M221]|nr:hypothetical protein IFR05_001419 [Cadophora sp. M221]